MIVFPADHKVIMIKVLEHSKLLKSQAYQRRVFHIDAREGTNG